MAESGEQTAFEADLARLIVDALRLETPAEEIGPDERLFIEGLGLDSIDALEIAVTVSSRYGVELKSDDERTRRVFTSLRTLAAFIEQNRTR